MAEWLPALDGVVAKLEAGGLVADVGCGHGASTILMAQAFPASRFVGIDYHAELDRDGAERAAEAGVADRVTFEVAGAAERRGGLRPRGLLRLVPRPRRPGRCGAARGRGARARRHLMLVEPYAGDRVEDNLNPVGRLYYGFSTLVCTPGSLSQPGRAGLGTQAGEARLREVLQAGGFGGSGAPPRRRSTSSSRRGSRRRPRARRGLGAARVRARMRRAAPFLVIALILALPALNAVGALTPLNDLLALGQGIGQKPAKVAIATRAEPPFVATPRAQCGPGSKPEPGIQGRVPAGSASDGLHCNVYLIAHQGTSGGFKMLRYIDPAGHECAFYDTALLFPVNALKLDTSSAGVAVLDMSTPRSRCRPRR